MEKLEELEEILMVWGWLSWRKMKIGLSESGSLRACTAGEMRIPNGRGKKSLSIRRVVILRAEISVGMPLHLL